MVIMWPYLWYLFKFIVSQPVIAYMLASWAYLNFSICKCHHLDSSSASNLMSHRQNSYSFRDQCASHRLSIFQVSMKDLMQKCLSSWSYYMPIILSNAVICSKFSSVSQTYVLLCLLLLFLCELPDAEMASRVAKKAYFISLS